MPWGTTPLFNRSRTRSSWLFSAFIRNIPSAFDHETKWRFKIMISNNGKNFISYRMILNRIESLLEGLLPNTTAFASWEGSSARCSLYRHKYIALTAPRPRIHSHYEDSEQRKGKECQASVSWFMGKKKNRSFMENQIKTNWILKTVYFTSVKIE